MTLGASSISYKLVDGWEQLPPGWSHGDVAGVATDAQDRVYVANRGEHPIIVYDRDGRFLHSWGEGIFTRAHGITIQGDLAYCVDDADHTVRAFTLDGTLRWTLGTPHQPSDTGYQVSAPANLLTIKHAAGPFNRPTRLVVAPNGEMYVADGYGNARIHRFSASGELLQSWGEPGDGPGQFHLPHSVWAHTDGRVFVCDRENDRIQIFSPMGELLTIWTNVTRPGDLFIDRDERVYVGEMAWDAVGQSMAGRAWPEARAAQVSVRDLNGNVLAHWGGPDPCTPGSFASPHGLWVDSHGDIYVAEVTQTALSRSGRWHPGCHSLQKFTRT